jgi:hypothetical protein
MNIKQITCTALILGLAVCAVGARSAAGVAIAPPTTDAGGLVSINAVTISALRDPYTPPTRSPYVPPTRGDLNP